MNKYIAATLLITVAIRRAFAADLGLAGTAQESELTQV